MKETNQKNTKVDTKKQEHLAVFSNQAQTGANIEPPVKPKETKKE